MSNESQASPLEILSGHFQSLDRKEVTVAGLPYLLYVPPLNLEHTLRVSKVAKEPNPARQAKLSATLIADVFELEDGSKAFKGKPDVADQMVKTLPPTCISGMIDAMMDGLEENALELEKLTTKKK